MWIRLLKVQTKFVFIKRALSHSINGGIPQYNSCRTQVQWDQLINENLYIHNVTHKHKSYFGYNNLSRGNANRRSSMRLIKECFVTLFIKDRRLVFTTCIAALEILFLPNSKNKARCFGCRPLPSCNSKASTSPFQAFQHAADLLASSLKRGRLIN